MKKVMAMVITLCLLTGCGDTEGAQDKLLQMRNKLMQGGCSFISYIHADFGDTTYDFAVLCCFDTQGNMTFEVKEPESISGITGKIDSAGGALTFDDKAVAFSLLADGEITPISGPWLMIKALRSGYLSAWREASNGTLLSIDDSYDGSYIAFKILISKDFMPLSGEILWKGRCVLSISVEEFRYL